MPPEPALFWRGTGNPYLDALLTTAALDVPLILAVAALSYAAIEKTVSKPPATVYQRA